MDVEKGRAADPAREIGAVTPDDESTMHAADQKPTDAAFAEAADVYGDAAVAAELGYVQRG
jgi:hypothetical protein